MKNARWVLGVLLGVGVSGVSVPAFAAPPATANVLQIGIGFRYGFELEEGDFNPWGPGIGVSGGYTLPSALYLGGNFDYFFGDNAEFAGGERSANIWQLMAEGGYDVGVGETFVIRPKLGIGFANTRVELCANFGLGEQCDSDSETDFAIAPGATFMYLGPSFSLSLDLRYDVIFADEETMNALLFSAGIGF